MENILELTIMKTKIQKEIEIDLTPAQVAGIVAEMTEKERATFFFELGKGLTMQLAIGALKELEKEKEIPKEVLPLPDGAVFLGRGGEFDINGKRFEGWLIDVNEEDDVWDKCSDLWGTYEEFFYAVPKDSEIAKLNGF